jgi:Ricin-type beta-trefoil lectin domain
MMKPMSVVRSLGVITAAAVLGLAAISPARADTFGNHTWQTRTTGRCLAAKGASGSPAFLWDCQAGWTDQQWAMTYAFKGAGVYLISNMSSGLCLTSAGYGEQAYVSACVSSPSQLWRPQYPGSLFTGASDYQIENMGDQTCLATHGGLGYPAFSWTCSLNDPAQVWY